MSRHGTRDHRTSVLYDNAFPPAHHAALRKRENVDPDSDGVRGVSGYLVTTSLVACNGPMRWDGMGGDEIDSGASWNKNIERDLPAARGRNMIAAADVSSYLAWSGYLFKELRRMGRYKQG